MTQNEIVAAHNPPNKIDRFQGPTRWLSNFWPVTVYLGGHSYGTVEHAFQAAKTDNQNERAAIRALPSTHQGCVQARAMGQKVTLRPGWDQSKLLVMEGLLLQKFLLYRELTERLAGTGDAELIEGNTWGDRFFGVCDGAGENHLGKLLMQIRAIAKHQLLTYKEDP